MPPANSGRQPARTQDPRGRRGRRLQQQHPLPHQLLLDAPGRAPHRLVVHNIKYSTSGRALLAIREDEVASEAVGVPTTRYKIAAFVIGAALAGFAGGLLEPSRRLEPQRLPLHVLGHDCAIVILGGQGSITGSALAAVLLTVLPVVMQRNPLHQSRDHRKVAHGAVRPADHFLDAVHAPRALRRCEITDLLAWALRRGRTKPRDLESAGELPPGIATLTAEARRPRRCRPAPGRQSPHHAVRRPPRRR